MRRWLAFFALLAISISTPTPSIANQTQKDLEAFSIKLNEVLFTEISLIEKLGEYVTLVEVAKESKNLKELNSLQGRVNLEINKHKTLSAEVSNLKALIDMACRAAREDKSRSEESLDTLDACAEAEIAYDVTNYTFESFMEKVIYVRGIFRSFGIVEPINQSSQSESAQTGASTGNISSKGAQPTTSSSKITSKKIVKSTITCIKGKLVKKVTGSPPICPEGYKKK